MTGRKGKGTQWEAIDNGETHSTARLAVPGGWLYLTRDSTSLTQCFVPDSGAKGG